MNTSQKPTGISECPGKNPWKFGTPGDHGLDAIKIEAAANAVGQIAGRQGIVFVRDGVIVYEKYWGSEYFLPVLTSVIPVFHRGSHGQFHGGVAVTRGVLKVDDLASKYHPADESGLHPMTTIKHLLTMSSGGTLVRKPSTQLPRKLGDTSPRGAGINYVRADKPQKGAPEGYGRTIAPVLCFFMMVYLLTIWLIL